MTLSRVADLHPQLQKDCLVVGRFPLCRLLMLRDAHYPWFVLVPDRDGISEIYQLSDVDQQQLLRESTLLSRALVAAFAPDKLNIAALGNVVPQLHLHHVVRYTNDAAWPAPVWGKVAAKEYTIEGLTAMVEKLRHSLTDNDFDYWV